jgi:predicted PurR-regulated permease PerM
MQTDLQQILESISNLEASLESKIKDSENRLETKFTDLKKDVEIFNNKFDNYQKATQSLVNLAFGLIASATIVTIVSNVFIRR